MTTKYLLLGALIALGISVLVMLHSTASLARTTAGIVMGIMKREENYIKERRYILDQLEILQTKKGKGAIWDCPERGAEKSHFDHGWNL